MPRFRRDNLSVFQLCYRCITISYYFYNYRQRSWYNEPKYLVDHKQLLEALKYCRKCACLTNVESTYRDGGYVKMTAVCDSCRHVRTWESSSRTSGRAVINILISAMILFTGCLPTKFLRAFSMLSIMAPSMRSFFRHQQHYLHGASL